MLVVFFGKAGVLADHDGLVRVDVLEHPDNEDGLSVVPCIKPGKYPFERHKRVLLPSIFLQYSTDFGGEKERRWDGENWDLREQQAQPVSVHTGNFCLLGVSQTLYSVLIIVMI